MLDDPQRDHRQLEHLPGLGRDHRRAGQRGPAASTRRRSVLHPLVGVLDLPQGPALVPGLASRPAIGALPPRPRRWLVIALARRRLMGVPWRLTRSALQLRDPIGQRHQLRGQHRVLRTQRGVALPQQHNRAIPLSQSSPRLPQLSAQPSNIETTCLCQRRPPTGEVAVNPGRHPTGPHPVCRSSVHDQDATPLAPREAAE